MQPVPRLLALVAMLGVAGTPGAWAQRIERFAPAVPVQESAAPDSDVHVDWPATCERNTGDRIAGGIGGAIIGFGAGALVVALKYFDGAGNPQYRAQQNRIIIGGTLIGAAIGAIWPPCIRLHQPSSG